MNSFDWRNFRETAYCHVVALSFLLSFQTACGQALLKFESHAPEASRFSFVAIGDAGEKNDILKDNAGAMARLFRNDPFELLVFLGDNFYKTGLNFDKAESRKEIEEETRKKIKNVLGPFREITQKLGRSRVHAIAGNHDYYTRLVVNKSLLFGLVNIEALPVGITNRGNAREAEIPFWTYHYGLPDHAFFQVGGTTDSLQVIFFDSAILLRTRPDTWRPYLDRLQRLLASTQNRPGVKWRIFTAHHPLYSVGAHGGYSEWDAEAQTVQFLNHCDVDSDAVGYFINLADPEDLCADRYRAYQDSAKAVIRRSGALVQVSLAGHDHSLQLLYYPGRDKDCSNCPKIHLVSGAGSTVSRVKSPSPQMGEFTGPDRRLEQQGKSQYGFVRFDIQGEQINVRFFSGDTKKEIDMGGRASFRIDAKGRLAGE
jgi:hypothetical protein